MPERKTAVHRSGSWVPCKERLPAVNGHYRVLRVMPSGRVSETELAFSITHIEEYNGMSYRVPDRWIKNNGKVLTTVTEWFEEDQKVIPSVNSTNEKRELAFNSILEELNEGIDRMPISGLTEDELYWRALGSLHMLRFLGIATAGECDNVRINLLNTLCRRLGTGDGRGRRLA